MKNISKVDKNSLLTYAMLHIKKLIHDKAVKPPEWTEKKIDELKQYYKYNFDHGYFYNMIFDTIRANVKGVWIYEYGWNYGADRFTVVLMNNTIAEYGQLMEELSKEVPKKYDFFIEKLYSNTHILNELGKRCQSNPFGWNLYYHRKHYQNGRKVVNRLIIRYENLNEIEYVRLLQGIVEAMQLIESLVKEMKLFLAAPKRKKVA